MLSRAEVSVDLAWNIPVTHRHSSFLMGASRGFAQISAILAPTVSGFLLSQVKFSCQGFLKHSAESIHKVLSPQDPEFGRRNVFSLSFAINTLGLILYVIFGKADVQDRAKERKLTRL
ncbi:hypothetical protein J1605_004448 [Eschrichtius robustus]|uniref:Uncharacterized protein n=1 Tax=Eschrichtius robustus TaxID=9764 RepID=A0AB34HHV6_ESCRO|nr:hypothetical protein J1605_004448 [Eschrichtius robustus]